jgi:hypothetical protein
MTVCKNCGTTQGPFVRDRDFPNTPICGFPPRYRFATREERFVAEVKKTRECLKRREERFSNESSVRIVPG